MTSDKKSIRSKGTLTAKQRVFVDEYLIDLNATQAAIRAGYSARNADKIGPELLGKTRVAGAISEAMAERERRTEIRQDEVLRELAKIAFANMSDYMSINSDGEPVLDFSNLSRDQAAALLEVIVDEIRCNGEVNKDEKDTTTSHIHRVKFKLHDKRKALVDIGRHLGMFTNRTELTGKEGKDLFPNKPEEATDEQLIHIATEIITKSARGSHA